MKEKNPERLIIDADVARSSGGGTPPHPTAKHCRDFLAMVSSLNYHVVMTAKISKEWTKHASSFACRWRVSMEASNKVCAISLSDDQVLYAQISSTARSKKQVKDIKKIFISFKQHLQLIEPSFRVTKKSDDFSDEPPNRLAKSEISSG